MEAERITVDELLRRKLPVHVNEGSDLVMGERLRACISASEGLALSMQMRNEIRSRPHVGRFGSFDVHSRGISVGCRVAINASG